MIRLATEEDIPGILECLSVLSDTTVTNPQYITYAWRDRERTNIFTFVYELDKKIVGTASVVMIRKLSHDGRRVYLLDDVAVHKDYQGKGIGKALTEACCSFCNSGDAYKMILNCEEKNIKFYEQFGFRKSGFEMRLDLN